MSVKSLIQIVILLLIPIIMGAVYLEYFDEKKSVARGCVKNVYAPLAEIWGLDNVLSSPHSYIMENPIPFKNI